MQTAKTKNLIEESPLRRFLRESGLKYRAVAKRADVPQSVFYDIIGGHRPVRIDEARRIVAALHEMTGRQLTIDDLWPAGQGE